MVSNKSKDYKYLTCLFNPLQAISVNVGEVSFPKTIEKKINSCKNEFTQKDHAKRFPSFFKKFFRYHNVHNCKSFLNKFCINRYSMHPLTRDYIFQTENNIINATMDSQNITFTFK